MRVEGCRVGESSLRIRPLKGKNNSQRSCFTDEESISKVKAQIRDMEILKKSSKREGKASNVMVVESHQCEEVMRELENVKQELSKHKLDMASVLEEKRQAEKKMEASSAKLRSSSSSLEALRKEIEEINEEQVFVELARIEALKDIGEIEAQREKEFGEFSSAMEETRKKMKDAAGKIDQSKELQFKLAVTLSDVNMLQNNLNLVKEMEKKVKRNDSLKHSTGGFRSREKMEGSTLLGSITEELDAAKKELASIKEDGLQFMASMYVTRSELKHVEKETIRLKEKEEKVDLTVQSLNSKLLRAKSKLEAASSSEVKVQSMVSNLSMTLESLKKEAEVAKKEKELIAEEAASFKAEILKTELQIDINRERLEAAMQELEAIKSSEVLALETLQNHIENTMRTRASASQHNSSITISKLEYEYLTGRAVGAKEIADKNVAAAQSWIEAWKASAREISMKIEIAQREIKQTSMEGEQEVDGTEKPVSAKRMVKEDLKNCGQNHEQNTESQNLQTPSRSSKLQNSASVRRIPRSTSFTVKKRTKVMTNFSKHLGGKRVGEDL